MHGIERLILHFLAENKFHFTTRMHLQTLRHHKKPVLQDCTFYASLILKRLRVKQQALTYFLIIHYFSKKKSAPLKGTDLKYMKIKLSRF